MRDAVGLLGTTEKSAAGLAGAGGARRALYLTAISLLLVLTGCGGKEKQSCTLSGFRATPGSPLAAGKAGTTILSADFNGDGRPDLAIPGNDPADPGSPRAPRSKGANGIAILLGNGRGGFETAPGSPAKITTKCLPFIHSSPPGACAGLSPIDLVIGDWNDDGHPDLADLSSGWSDEDIVTLLGNGKGEFEHSKPKRFKEIDIGSPAYLVSSMPLAPVTGDFNDDGRADIATADGYVLLDDGEGDFAERPDSSLIESDSASAVAVGDFNGDHRQDLAFSGRGNNVLAYLGDGKGGFEAAPNSPFEAGGWPSGIAVGDFNSDDHEDIAVANSGSNDVTVLLGNGKGNFEPAIGSPFRVGGEPLSIALGDFNGDEKLDIATADYLSNGVSVLLGNGKGGFRKAPSSPYAIDTASKPIGAANAPQGLQNLVAADFDGNGRDDLAVAGFQRSGVSVLPGRCR